MQGFTNHKEYLLSAGAFTDYQITVSSIYLEPTSVFMMKTFYTDNSAILIFVAEQIPDYYVQFLQRNGEIKKIYG
jgi:hypothetical protein